MPDVVAIVRHAVAVWEPAHNFALPFAAEKHCQNREPDGKEPDVGEQPDIEAVGLRVLLQRLEPFEPVLRNAEVRRLRECLIDMLSDDFQGNAAVTVREHSRILVYCYRDMKAAGLAEPLDCFVIERL